MRISRVAPIAAIMLAAVFVAPSKEAKTQEQQCTPEQFAELVDKTGGYLRSFSSSQKPRLHAKFQALAKAKGWPPETTEERGYQLVQDDKTAEYDTRARKLLIELDQIDAAGESQPTCTALERLQAVTLEIRAVTKAKFDHMIAAADQALASSKQPQSAAKTESPPRATPRETKRLTTPPQQQPIKPSANADQRQNNPSASTKKRPWQTTTEVAQAPSPDALRALPRPQPMPPATTYSVAEIRNAGRGFFGNISTGLASVIQFTFENYGAPNGYILGNEGGGAFLAGLSFGEGTLNTKLSTPLKVFWQGPTVGYDFGLQGSRVMFLVYNLPAPERIFARYGGIGGSAYIVGGVGLTYHKRGKVVLAPIRTGLGLRVGANIGYLKFTPRLSINPF